MGKFDGFMIVTDLDGTFFGENTTYVERNIKAIEYFKNNGGRFTVATGRDSYFVTNPFPQVIELCNAPLITSNGACIYNPAENTLECLESLPSEKTLEIIRLLLAVQPELRVRLSLADGYVYEKEEQLMQFDREGFRGLVTVEPFDAFLDKQWLKVVAYGRKEQINHACEYLNTLDAPGFHFVSAFDENVEILSEKATKGAKLKVLKEYIGRTDIKIAAIGDYFNDYEMISSADIPATVENGVDLLKQIPGVYVTCHHRDGAIADLIEHIERTLI